MKTFGIEIKPLSGFGTPLKGDTIFGQFISTVFEDESILGINPNSIIEEYTKNPQIIFSSAFPVKKNNGSRIYYFPKPALPGKMLFPNENDEIAIAKRKERKKKRWIAISDATRIGRISDGLVADEFEVEHIQYHNTINRITGTTGTAPFLPYALTHTFYKDNITLIIFAVADDKIINPKNIRSVMERIGSFGFGRDASIGFGRFKVEDLFEFELASIGNNEPNACWTLAPAVPEKNYYEKMYYQPFIRYGRHGGKEASSAHPFKNPVVMADEGAVFIPKSKDQFNRSYLGTAVTGISKTIPSAVSQGYAPYIPIRLEALL